MNLTFGSRIRPGRISMQEQREEYLGLENKFRWGMRLKLTRGLGQEIAALNGLLLAATDLACLLLHVWQ